MANFEDFPTIFCLTADLLPEGGGGANPFKIFTSAPIPNYTNQISSLYLKLSITAISIHNATQLSCQFWKIATVSHFWLVFELSCIPKDNFENPCISYIAIGITFQIFLTIFWITIVLH